MMINVMLYNAKHVCLIALLMFITVFIWYCLLPYLLEFIYSFIPFLFYYNKFMTFIIYIGIINIDQILIYSVLYFL